MTDLIYKDLCYKVNGLAFEIFNTLGGELRENTQNMGKDMQTE